MKKFVILLMIMLSSFMTVIPEDQAVKFDSQQAISLTEQFQEIDDMYNMEKLNAIGLEGFLKDIGARESGNNPEAINTYGYIGEFQFGKAALTDVGYGHVSVNEFKKDKSIFTPEEQRDAMIKYMKINKRRLSRMINKYEGKVINGIEITESGILAASHLAGAGGVKKFLRSGGKYNPADGYGTRLTHYLKKFSKHKFDLDYV